MNKILFSMVISVNKWFSFSLIGCFFSVITFGPAEISINFLPSVANRVPPKASALAQGVQTAQPGTAWPHPFHVSTTEINHNAADKILEISCRLFVDDFESCLSKRFHTKADLSAASVKTSMDTLVKKYLSTHLQIKADGKAAPMQYLGFEKEDEAVNVYFEVDNIVSVKKFEINDSILYDLYDDQMNIIHVVVAGNRKSTKLDYPNREAVFGY
jgi:hypothetical protein